MAIAILAAVALLPVHFASEAIADTPAALATNRHNAPPEWRSNLTGLIINCDDYLAMPKNV
jgi:hypothetical protein